MKPKNSPKDITAIMRDGKLIDEAMQKAVREAIKKHRMYGVPMVVWKDGEIKEISPDEMEQNLDRARSEK